MRKNSLKSRKNEENHVKKFKNYLKEQFDSQEIEKIARETGFIQRSSSKIDAFNFLACLMFNEQEQKDTSLLNMRLDFLEQYDCDISREAIHKRFNQQAVNFMQTILSRHMVQRFEVDSQLNSKFKSVSIKDSTKFRIPKSLSDHYPSYNGIGKDQALMNLQYEFDLFTGNWKRFDITKATRNDQEDSKTTLDNIQEGDLLLRDLGYVTMTYLQEVAKRKAYYVNRLPPTFNVYYMDDGEIKKISWIELHDKIKQNGIDQMELNVFLGKNQMLPCRLILKPVPEQVYQQRIRKVSKHAKSKGVQVSKEYKIKARYNMFITNTTQDQLSTREIGEVYRLRWQIEVVFKTWKSHIKLHMTKKVKKERFECQLIAKMIWIILNWRLFQIANLIIKSRDNKAGCSIAKFFKQAMKFMGSLKYVIVHNEDINHWFTNIFKPIVPNLLLEKKNGKKTHCQIYTDTLLYLG